MARPVVPLIQLSPSVSRFTLDRVKPHLRADLDRYIMAIAEESADLIGSDREAVIEATLGRFAAWITSVPTDIPSGRPSIRQRSWNKLTSLLTGNVQHEMHAKCNRDIPAELAKLTFAERHRLVMLDQGVKFSGYLQELMSIDGGAIAAVWHSHWRQENYEFRPSHKERDEKAYTLRGNWAIERGLMKVGLVGYADEVTKPGEEPGCRCYYQYVYGLRSLPRDMVTEKGRVELKAARAALDRGDIPETPLLKPSQGGKR